MSYSRRQVVSMLAGGAVAPACPSLSRAQAYPSRPIRLVVPFPPGGAFDTVGRPWAEAIRPHLGTVVVENMGGAGSSLGAAAAARAEPDGHTILLGGTQTHVNEALLKSRPLYDPVKDLDPIAGIAAYPLCIAVNPGVPAQNLTELIAHGKAGATLSYGHAGVGSIQHLTGELFKSLAGTPGIVQVPYRGTGPAITDLVSGHIQIAVLGLTGQIIEFHRSGKMRVLAVTGPNRLAAASELPTAVEAGVPGLVATGLIGLLAPTRTPRSIVDQVAQTTRKVLADPNYRQLLVGAGMEPSSASTPESFRKALADDITLWTPVVRSLALKVD
jgi:tripartite-type tricarboxylate transporter receptor subunit TctC